MDYQREEIGRGRAEEGGKIGIEGEEVFQVNQKKLRVFDEAFSVRKHVFISLEVSNKLLELDQGRVAAVICIRRRPHRIIGKLRLVAVIHCAFVPTRHCFSRLPFSVFRSLFQSLHEQRSLFSFSFSLLQKWRAHAVSTCFWRELFGGRMTVTWLEACGLWVQYAISINIR